MKLFLALSRTPHFVFMPHALGYPYRLFSYYYMADSDERMQQKVLETSLDGSEWIMDSGLFTYMFGAGAGGGALDSYEKAYAYASKYVEDMHRWNWKHAIVECDVQRVLGVDACERLRDEVFRPSGFEVIYVWHLPEKVEGLRALASREKRIALSVPELRQVFGGGSVAGGPKVKSVLISLLNEIRRTGAEPRVHLLGNSENSLVSLPADSADASTWTAAGRWGTGYYFDFRTNRLGQASIYSPKWRQWRRWCEGEFPRAFEAMRREWTKETNRVYIANVMCCAVAMWLLQEAINGTSSVHSEPEKLLTGFAG